ncbi:MAG: glutamine amidotransferase [Thermoanaerobaculia bacterium]|nr:glutamine amidotransferase [Thermoanaerobaculia bacterium]
MPRFEPFRSPRLALLLAALSSTGCIIATSKTTLQPPTATTTPTAAKAPGWRRLPAPTDLPADRPLTAGFLIVDGVYNSELMAPYDVLQHTIFHTKPRPGIEVFTVSPDGAAVTTFEGLKIVPHYSFASAPPIDVLVVPSAEHSMDSDLENEAMIGWVREVGAKARVVLSLCDGAFVLAKAGLLEGRAVTTFPGDQDRFAEMFPHLDLRREVSFVHDGSALTSQGGAKSYDPAMYLVDHLYGEKVAQGVGRGLIIPWPPTAAAMPAVVVHPHTAP